MNADMLNNKIVYTNYEISTTDVNIYELIPQYTKKEKVIMQHVNSFLSSLTAPRRVYFLIPILTVFLFLSLGAPQAAASVTSIPFNGEFEANFNIAGGAGNSSIFFVAESGEGESTFGDFTFTTFLSNNEARLPPGCGFGSSTGVDGYGFLNFNDGLGQIKLKRISGTACFSYPIVYIEEQWVIASGTGIYAGVTGKFERRLYGDVTTWNAHGWFDGTMKLP